MYVWIVTKAWCPNTDLETLESWDGFQQIIGVYDSEEKARAVQEDLLPDDNLDVCIEQHYIE